MIHSLSQNVVLPIAGLVLAFVMTLELIHMLVDRNNLHDVDTWMFFKWIFKTACSVFLLTHTWDIVMGVFDIGQSVMQQAAGVIRTDTAIDIAAYTQNMQAELMQKGVGGLIGIWVQSSLIYYTLYALAICIFVICYGRMLEIYIVTSLAPIPVATLTNKEQGQMGQNYLKSLLALAFQGFLIMVCIGIYAVLVGKIQYGGDIIASVWGCMGYTVLLCFALFKTGTLSKTVFGAH